MDTPTHHTNETKGSHKSSRAPSGLHHGPAKRGNRCAQIEESSTPGSETHRQPSCHGCSSAMRTTNETFPCAWLGIKPDSNKAKISWYLGHLVQRLVTWLHSVPSEGTQNFLSNASNIFCGMGLLSEESVPRTDQAIYHYYTRTRHQME